MHVYKLTTTYYNVCKFSRGFSHDYAPTRKWALPTKFAKLSLSSSIQYNQRRVMLGHVARHNYGFRHSIKLLQQVVSAMRTLRCQMSRFWHNVTVFFLFLSGVLFFLIFFRKSDNLKLKSLQHMNRSNSNCFRCHLKVFSRCVENVFIDTT